MLGGEEYLIEWDNGDTGWVNKWEAQDMDVTNTRIVHERREAVRERPATFTEHMRDYRVEADPQSWGETWREFLVYAQQGNRGEAALENATIEEVIVEANPREPYPTLYPGEEVGGIETDKDTKGRGRNLTELTKRARVNQHKQEKKRETHQEKRIRLAKEEAGTRTVSEKP
eukprot:1094914-Pleurochrysis_carterae.AAC.1